MNLYKFIVRHDPYGTESELLYVVSTKTLKQLSKFAKWFFDIMLNKDSHGFESKSKTTKKVAEYVKKELKLTDEDLLIFTKADSFYDFD